MSLAGDTEEIHLRTQYPVQEGFGLDADFQDRKRAGTCHHRTCGRNIRRGMDTVIRTVRG